MTPTTSPAHLTFAHRIGGWAAFLCAVHCLLWPVLAVALAVWGLVGLPYVDVGMAGVSLAVLLVAAPHESPRIRAGFAVSWILLAAGIAAELSGLHRGGMLTVAASLALALLHFGLLRARRQSRRAC